MGTVLEGFFVNNSRLNMKFKDCDAEIVFTPVIFSLQRAFFFCIVCFPVV
jgi:hypothetical protein